MNASLVAAFLAVFSFVGSAKAYDYEAHSLQTTATVIKCIYGLFYLGLAGLSVPVLAVARGHRLPYVPILIGILLTFVHILASVARDFLIADADPFDDIPGEAYIATGAISSLFFNWSLAFVFLGFAHLIKVRADKILQSSGAQKSGLNMIFSIAYLAAFVVVFVFATACSGTYIKYLQMIYGDERSTNREIRDKVDLYNNLLYTFNALWYASAFVLGGLGFLAIQFTRRAGVNDKVLKTLLFVAFPIHILHVLEEMAFLIVWSPSGLEVTARNIEDAYAASLAETILYLGLHGATMAVLIFLGLRRSNWASGTAPTAWQAGQYAGYTAYPMQGSYPAQGVYDPAQQTTYPAQPVIQAGYSAQNQYEKT